MTYDEKIETLKKEEQEATRTLLSIPQEKVGADLARISKGIDRQKNITDKPTMFYKAVEYRLLGAAYFLAGVMTKDEINSSVGGCDNCINVVLEGVMLDSVPAAEASAIIRKLADRSDVINDGALEHAAYCGEKGHNAARVLIESGANVNAVTSQKNVNVVNSRNLTVLNNAASQNNRFLVEMLLNNGAQVNKGDNPLIDAVWTGDKHLVQMLIDAGADPKHPKVIESAARRENNGEVLRLLFKYEASKELCKISGRENLATFINARFNAGIKEVSEPELSKLLANAVGDGEAMTFIVGMMRNQQSKEAREQETRSPSLMDVNEKPHNFNEVAQKEKTEDALQSPSVPAQPAQQPGLVEQLKSTMTRLWAP